MCGPCQTLSPSSGTQKLSGTGVLCAVTEREVKQLWRLFKETDKDQDGKVSQSEMITSAAKLKVAQERSQWAPFN